MAKREPDEIVNLKVRFTEAMRRRIEEEAKRNHRSLNGEIVHRLATSFGAEGIALRDQYELAEKEMKSFLSEVVRKLIEEGPGPKPPTPPIKRRA
jgi:hypothetical protein